MKHLILGGARSGKSSFAETCAQRTGKQVVYIATAEARDPEMTARIDHHRQRRSAQWQLIEEPLHLARALQAVDRAECAVLVDCLTLWLSNCLEKNCFVEEQQHLLNCFSRLQASVFLVSNEVGSGVVPLGTLSREFVDRAGWLHQALAERCEHVTLVVAGQALSLKNSSSQAGDAHDH